MTIINSINPSLDILIRHWAVIEMERVRIRRIQIGSSVINGDDKVHFHAAGNVIHESVLGHYCTVPVWVSIF